MSLKLKRIISLCLGVLYLASMVCSLSACSDNTDQYGIIIEGYEEDESAYFLKNYNGTYNSPSNFESITINVDGTYERTYYGRTTLEHNLDLEPLGIDDITYEDCNRVESGKIDKVTRRSADDRKYYYYQSTHIIDFDLKEVFLRKNPKIKNDLNCKDFTSTLSDYEGNHYEYIEIVNPNQFKMGYFTETDGEFDPETHSDKNNQKLNFIRIPDSKELTKYTSNLQSVDCDAYTVAENNGKCVGEFISSDGVGYYQKYLISPEIATHLMKYSTSDSRKSVEFKLAVVPTEYSYLYSEVIEATDSNGNVFKKIDTSK